MWPKHFYSQQAGDGDGAGGGGDEPWYAGLSSNEGELPAIVTEATDFDALVKQATDYQAMQGSSLRIPGPDASDEDRATFYEKLAEKVPDLMAIPAADDLEGQKALALKLGVPEAKEGYELPAPPDGQKVDEALQTWFLEAAHNRKLSKAQAKGLFEDFNSNVAEREAQALAGLKEQEVKLRQDWGATYDPQMKKIDTLLGNYPEFAELRENIAKGIIPSHVLKGFASIAEGLMGKGFEMLGQKDATGAITPQEAALQSAETLDKLSKLPPNDPQRKPLMDRLIELNTLANPGIDTAAPSRAGYGSG